MLPLFQIITSSPAKEMPTNDVPAKSRRKKVDVPVHKIYQSHKEGRKKSFSANFNAHKDKHRNKETEIVDHQPIHTEVIVEIPDSDRSAKVSKKQLAKENLKLTNENKELIVKFNELEDLSVKKITKLREKIGSLQLTNAEIEKENKYLNEQYQDLLYNYESAQKQLESSRVCKNCEELSIVIDKYSAENTLLKNSSKELAEDLDMLKTVVYRLNVQLERYQETLRRSNIRITKQYPAITDAVDSLEVDENISKNILSEVHKNHRHTPISWGSVNVHTLGPLLDAYEDRLKEKEEIIQGYDNELSNFTGKLKEIMEENEILHSKLTLDEGCSSKLKVELVNMKQELKSAREQNDLLIKKCAMKQDKVEEILKVYEAKVEQMNRDFGVLHEEYVKCRTENAALKEKSKSLVDAQEDFRTQMQSYIPISVHNASVNECKKWYEELKQQYEAEKQKLKINIESQAKSINELNGEVSNLRHVKEGLEAKILQLEKHIKKWETKCLELEHALSEIQLSRSALRKQLHKVMGFAKDMVAEQETLLKALNQRHLENKAVKRIGSDMATKMDSLKNQLKDVQKNAWQEFTTVEQKIQEQTDLIETMKDEHQKEIEKLQKIIQEQQETNLLLKSDNLPIPHYLLYKDKYK
ncbi:protein Cep89 homolog [Anoplophora glabripennis]|uniref:protein Cep89 homolog n=1 Tax=Anoplophora glabripennis TaxID=217634 RepID=UPI000873FAF3|nr:protein Cep89 homolog [Anoplophora glabripennis]